MKTPKAPTPTKSQEAKQDGNWFTRSLTLGHALTELVVVYVFATQDNPVLWGVGAIVGLHAVVYFVNRNVIK